MTDGGGDGALPAERLILCNVCLMIAPRPPDASRVTCPHCGSLDRHRMMLLLILGMARDLPDLPILDLAPFAGVTRAVRDTLPHLLLTLDRDPAADGRRVDLVADATGLPFVDGTFGLVVSSHVLEHIPDDRGALSEMGRVVHPQGLVMVLTPRRAGSPTDEDLSADENERARRFGQRDHVRLYGDDLERRIESAGLGVEMVKTSTLLPAPLLELIGVSREIPVWLASPGGPPSPDADSLFDALAARLAEGMARLQREAEEAHAVAGEWKALYHHLESLPSVKWGRRVKRVLGR